MALINCPKCGKYVSDKASKCLHCGADFKDFLAKVKNMGSADDSINEASYVAYSISSEPHDLMDKDTLLEKFEAELTGEAEEADSVNGIQDASFNVGQANSATPVEELEDKECIGEAELEEAQEGTDNDENKVSDIQSESSTPTVKSKSHAWVWILVISLVIIFAGCGVGGYFYYQTIYLPEKIDREAPRTYPIVNLYIRSTKDSGGDFNKVGLVPYGGELITYSQGDEWAKVKYKPADPTQPILEGYVASLYLMPKSDFKPLNGFFGNDEARQVIETSKCRRALLNYFKDRGLVGRVMECDTLGIIPTDENQWQAVVSSVYDKPNEVFFKRVLNRESKFTDFAVVLTNIVTGKGRLVYFTFNDDETPHFIAEYDMPYPGKIVDITYDPYRQHNLEIKTTVGTLSGCDDSLLEEGSSYDSYSENVW